MAPVSTTGSLKLTGTVTEAAKSFSKTISGLKASSIGNAEQINAVVVDIFKILDNGAAKTFSLISTNKYNVVAS